MEPGQYVVKAETTTVDTESCSLVVTELACPCGLETAELAVGAAVGLPDCVRVHGQSVIVRVVLPVAVYVWPLNVSSVELGQKVVNDDTTVVVTDGPEALLETPEPAPVVEGPATEGTKELAEAEPLTDEVLKLAIDFTELGRKLLEVSVLGDAEDGLPAVDEKWLLNVLAELDLVAGLVADAELGLELDNDFLAPGHCLIHSTT